MKHIHAAKQGKLAGRPNLRLSLRAGGAPSSSPRAKLLGDDKMDTLRTARYRDNLLNILPEELLSLLGKPIGYYPKLAALLGGVNPALFICQLLFWAGKGRDPDGWVYKTMDDISSETGLSKNEQKTARKILREFQLLEEKKVGLPAKNHYRIAWAVLLEMLMEPAHQSAEKQPTSEIAFTYETQNSLVDGKTAHYNKDLTPKKTAEEEIANSSPSLLIEKNDGKEPKPCVVVVIDPKSRESKSYRWPSVEGLVALYNAEAADELPAVEVLSPSRCKKGKAYLDRFPDLTFWREIMAETKKSSLLRGLKGSPGHENFDGNFDWLLTVGKDQTENCVKVFEGKYRDRKPLHAIIQRR